jgi:hypothetical protein
MTGPTSALNFSHQAGDNIRQTVKRIVPTAANDKFVQVSLKPLIPVIMATCALVYHEGQQKRLAEEEGVEAKSSWQRIVAESTLGYLLLKYTSGVYPLLGLGLAIGRASHENNALDQLKAAISTAVTLTMGFLGANIMDPDVLERLEDGKLKKLFECGGDQGKQGHLAAWIDQLKSHADDHPLKAMGEHLAGLKSNLLNELPVLEKAKDKESLAKLKLLRENISQLKAGLGEKIAEVGEAALDLAKPEATPIARSLIERLAESQSAMTKLTRVVNPVCCFMASAFLLGAPLGNWINSKLEHRHPELKKKQMKHVLFPDSQRVLKQSEEANTLKSHGEHTYRVNPGPFVSCPDVADGRPMQ